MPSSSRQAINEASLSREEATPHSMGSRRFYAEEGTRTPTGLHPLRPERSASTYSATSAHP